MKDKGPQERIKLAALQLFGDKGFKATTIRDICTKADISLALVNYHFRNKQNLYEELTLGIVHTAFEENPISNYVSPDMSPDERLRNIIRLLLHRLLGKNGLGKNPYAVKLIARELTNPSRIMDVIYSDYILKMIELMISAVKELIGEEVADKDMMRFVSSIAGQCLHPLLAKEILAKSGLTVSENDEEIEIHAKHIYCFSMNGINGYNRGVK